MNTRLVELISLNLNESSKMTTTKYLEPSQTCYSIVFSLHVALNREEKK